MSEEDAYTDDEHTTDDGIFDGELPAFYS